MSRVARALVLPTTAKPAQPVITRRTKRVWLNVGVVSFFRAARALNATRHAATVKESQTTAPRAPRVTLLSTEKVRAVLQIVRLVTNQPLYHKYVSFKDQLCLKDALR